MTIFTITQTEDQVWLGTAARSTIAGVRQYLIEWLHDNSDLGHPDDFASAQAAVSAADLPTHVELFGTKFWIEPQLLVDEED